MPWLRFDDATADHPKFSALEDYAPLCGWLWFAACCYSMRFLTDGRIELVTLRRLWPYKHIGVATAGIGDGRGGILAEVGEDPTVDDLVTKLVSVHLLDEMEPGVFRIHDFLKYNPSRREILKARKRNNQRQEGFRERRRNAVSNGVRNGDVILPPSPSPSPSPETQESNYTVGQRPTARAYRESAESILIFLNERTGKSFRLTRTNLSLIEARLKSGASLQDCKSLIARKAREWTPDPKMAMYLRPATLFNATKFEQYLGEMNGHDAH